MYKQLEWHSETLKNLSNLRAGPMELLMDRVFLAEIFHNVNLAEKAYEAYNFRDAQKYGFFELQKARDKYRKMSEISGVPMHRDLIVHFITVRWRARRLRSGWARGDGM